MCMCVCVRWGWGWGQQHTDHTFFFISFHFFFIIFFSFLLQPKLRRPARDPGLQLRHDAAAERDLMHTTPPRRLINGPRGEAAGVPVPGQPPFVQNLEGSGEVVLAEN